MSPAAKHYVIHGHIFKRVSMDSFERSLEMWLLIHIAVSTDKIHFLQSNCDRIRYLIFVKVQLESMNKKGNTASFFFLHLKKFTNTPPLRMHFHAMHNFTRFILLQVKQIMDYWHKGSTATNICY